MANKIIINLNDDRDAYEVPTPSDMIHLNELDQIKSILNDLLVAAKEYADSKTGKFVRKHDTIMLAGVRGSGKTTFMLSLLNFIRDDKQSLGLTDENGIEVLIIFDPTLIEDKVHVFINIISMIKDRINYKAKKSNCFNDPDCTDGQNYKEWEKSFKKLAEGLPAIDGVGNDGFSGAEWLDSEFIMNIGVGRAHAANHLERNFHDFVRNSLKFLGKSAFLLCFDDVDTNFVSGWPVLEVLHKYLTTPQLITILSGDLGLYSTLIRDQQWKNFSDKLLSMEGKVKEERQSFKETVAHLEEQYALKLLKPQLRVSLNNLFQLEQRYGTNSIQIQHNNITVPETLSSLYSKLFSSLGIGRSDRSDSYRFLASLPLRSQKQLLYAYVQQEYPSSLRREFTQDILDIFWSDLTVKYVDVSSLRNNPQNIAIHTLNYLVTNNLLTEGFTLNQSFSEPIINGVQFALSAMLNDQTRKDPSQAFEYWMRVCMARELGVLMGDRVVSRGEGPTLQNFIDHCALGQNKATRYLARFCTAYFRAFRGYDFKSKEVRQQKYATGAWHGTLPLYAYAKTSRQATEKIENRIDHVLNFKTTSAFLRVMGTLPLSGATDHNKKSLPIYSIYNILGILGQVIKTSRESTSEIDETAKQIASLLYRYAQFREYPLPSWASSYTEEVASSEENHNNEYDQNSSDLEVFAKRLVCWSKIDVGSNISAALFGRIFTRLFYTLNNLDSNYTERLLGSWLHRMIIIFLHSVVVVDAMEEADVDVAGIGLFLTNPVETDYVFVGNLKKFEMHKISNNSKLLTFSKWILSCPLWSVYLLNNTENKDLSLLIANYCKEYISSKVSNECDQSYAVYDQDDFNVCKLLNDNNVVVRMADKVVFTFTAPRKGRLSEIFRTSGMTMEDVSKMNDVDLSNLVQESALGNTYSFKESIASDIKKSIKDKKLTW